MKSTACIYEYRFYVKIVASMHSCVFYDYSHVIQKELND